MLLSIIKAGLTTFLIPFKGNSIITPKRLVNITNFVGHCNTACCVNKRFEYQKKLRVKCH
jgi:hypothetical protein